MSNDGLYISSEIRDVDHDRDRTVIYLYGYIGAADFSTDVFIK